MWSDCLSKGLPYNAQHQPKTNLENDIGAGRQPQTACLQKLR